MRVALGPDQVSGRSRVRSLTVHSESEVAETARDRWAADAAELRSRGARPGITATTLLQDSLSADHAWRPSTLRGYRSAAGFLIRDGIGDRQSIDISPTVLRAACKGLARLRLAGPDGVGKSAGIDERR